MPTVKFAVTPSNTSSQYWIAVDHQDIPLNLGVGSVALPPGDHMLVWWFTGNPGDTLAIEGTSNDQSVVSVKSTIPDGETACAGKKRFTLKQP